MSADYEAEAMMDRPLQPLTNNIPSAARCLSGIGHSAPAFQAEFALHLSIRLSSWGLASRRAGGWRCFSSRAASAKPSSSQSAGRRKPNRKFWQLNPAPIGTRRNSFRYPRSDKRRRLGWTA